jgi:hypothetical protein
MNEIRVGDEVRIIGKESAASKENNNKIGIVETISVHLEANKLYCWINLESGEKTSIWLDECELVEKRNRVYGIALFMMKGVVKC